MGHLKEFFGKIIGAYSRRQIVEEAYRNLNLIPGCIGVTNKKYFEQDITISLTTYSKRVFDVYLVIESIFQQTVKPNKVILWIAENEFEKTRLPIKLTKLCERGLQIKYYKDIKSYKKLIPTIQLYPNDIIITIDDDVIYPDDFIENLVNAYSEDKKLIYCYRGRRISYGKNNLLKKYKNWEIINQPAEPSFDIMPNGIGGVLYPPNCFYKDILNEDLFLSLAPTADDVWFKVMTYLNGYKCKVISIESSFFYKFTVIESSQDIALYHSNIGLKSNDKQIKNVFDYYSIDAQKLKNGYV